MAFIRGFWGVMAFAVLLAACQQPGTEAPSLEEDDSPEALIELGRSIVETSGCHDCHTPKVFGGPVPELDANRWLAGQPVEVGVMDSLPAELNLEPGGWGAVTNNHLTAGEGRGASASL